jgi:LPPG:FO 2-phospho-L-lactate transferase
MVATDQGEMSFQRYFVAEQCQPSVRGFRFEGVSSARLLPEIVQALRDGVAAIVICPSNPFVSVDPILAVPGFGELLRSAGAPLVAVSPIVGGMALKGPAAKMLAECGHECSALGIAHYYRHLIQGIVIDEIDAAFADPIRALGIEVAVEASVMKTEDDKVRLAGKTLALAQSINGRGG